MAAFTQQDLNALQLAIKDKIETLETEDSFFHSISFVLADGTAFYRSAQGQATSDNYLGKQIGVIVSVKDNTIQ